MEVNEVDLRVHHDQFSHSTPIHWRLPLRLPQQQLSGERLSRQLLAHSSILIRSILRL